MTDIGTPLSGRVTIGEDFTLKISSVKPSDQLTYYCQVNAGKDGYKEGTTNLDVFGTQLCQLLNKHFQKIHNSSTGFQNTFISKDFCVTSKNISEL